MPNLVGSLLPIRGKADQPPAEPGLVTVEIAPPMPIHGDRPGTIVGDAVAETHSANCWRPAPPPPINAPEAPPPAIGGRPAVQQHPDTGDRCLGACR